MDYAVSRFAEQVLTVQPAHAGVKEWGSGIQTRVTNPGIHIRFTPFKHGDSFETSALPRVNGRSVARGFLNIDLEVSRLSNRLPGEKFPQKKEFLVNFLEEHPANAKNDGTGFAMFIEGVEVEIDPSEIMVPQPEGTNLVHCRICDKNIKKGPGVPAHERSAAHQERLKTVKAVASQQAEATM